MKKYDWRFDGFQRSIKWMFFYLIQLAIGAIRDILLEVTVQFSYVYGNHDFIINFMETAITLFIVGKFDFFLCFQNIKTFSAVVFIRVINQTVAVLKSEFFKRRWVVFPVFMRVEEIKNSFLLFVIQVNLFETCFEIIRPFYQNNMVNGEKFVFDNGMNMVRVENVFGGCGRYHWCLNGQMKQNVGYYV